MSALQFLNKKSWHTATIRNNEKVWLKEQDAAQEKARIDELQKQLAEERKLQEVQRLELESGRLSESELLKRRRLNWMYEHAPISASPEKPSEKEREDIMLGRKEIDLHHLPAAGTVAKDPILVDAEAKLREDPLLIISREKARSHALPPRPTLPTPHRSVNALLASHEATAKLQRREMRYKIREDRRRRREDRAMRKRKRCNGDEELDTTVTGGQHLAHVVCGSNEQRDATDLTEREVQYKVDNVPVRNKRKTVDVEERGAPYGLHVPVGGTGVAVTSDFVRRDRGRREDGGHSVGHSSRATARGAVERKLLLNEMRENALRVDAQRKEKVSQHEREVQEEMEEMERRGSKRFSEDPVRRFAREAVERGGVRGSRR